MLEAFAHTHYMNTSRIGLLCEYFPATCICLAFYVSPSNQTKIQLATIFAIMWFLYCRLLLTYRMILIITKANIVSNNNRLQLFSHRSLITRLFEALLLVIRLFLHAIDKGSKLSCDESPADP